MNKLKPVFRHLRKVFTFLLKPFQDKNRRLAISVSLGYLIVLFLSDSLIVWASRHQHLSAGVSGWWSLMRVILLFWVVFVYKYVRTFDKSDKH